MKQLFQKCTLLALFLAISISSFAGESHYAYSSDRETACTLANEKAKRAADKKKTCYDECDVRACVKQSDGTWMCVATSANHAGSCP
jgi:hypothetical protein